MEHTRGEHSLEDSVAAELHVGLHTLSYPGGYAGGTAPHPDASTAQPATPG